MQGIIAKYWLGRENVGLIEAGLITEAFAKWKLD